MTQAALVENVVYLPTRLELGDVGLEDWKKLASTLGDLEKSRQWWIGDLLLYGEKTFDEETFYQAAIDFGLADKTILNYRSICAHVDPSIRREGLSFSIHAEIAYLDRPSQIAWLDRAEAEHLDVRELRALVRGEEPAAEPLPGVSDSDEEIQKLIERVELGLRDAMETAVGVALPNAKLSDLRELVRIAKRLTRGSE